LDGDPPTDLGDADFVHILKDRWAEFVNAVVPSAMMALAQWDSEA
jgi:hypothetical protein